MQNSVGTIIAAIVISLALLVLFRWELVAAGDGMATNGVYRLDRWSGAIVACGQKSSPPVALDCEPKIATPVSAPGN